MQSWQRFPVTMSSVPLLHEPPCPALQISIALLALDLRLLFCLLCAGITISSQHRIYNPVMLVVPVCGRKAKNSKSSPRVEFETGLEYVQPRSSRTVVEHI